MKLELEFQSGDDLVNFMASLTSPARKMVGLTEKVATAAAREVNTRGTDPHDLDHAGLMREDEADGHRLKPINSAAVTPEKQEKARVSTKKDKPAETPEAALTQALTYEKDLGPLFAKAVVHNKPAALKALWPFESGPAVPKDVWPQTMGKLTEVLAGPTEADTPALDYERDVVPKAKLAQAKDKAALAEILKSHGGVGEDGKVSGRFLKPDVLGDVVKALDALLGGA